MADPETVRRGYDALAERYADRETNAAAVDVLERFLEGVAGRVLDAGCGDGRPALERLDAPAVGLDVSRGQLSVAADAAPAAALVQGEMSALPFDDDAFDAVVAYWSLIHVPLADHRAVIAEFRRVLRPDGRLLLVEGTDPWVGENPDWLGAGVEMQWEIAGAEATAEQLAGAGFEVETGWRVPETLADDTEAGRSATAREVDVECLGDDAELPWTVFAARLEH